MRTQDARPQVWCRGRRRATMERPEDHSVPPRAAPMDHRKLTLRHGVRAAFLAGAAVIAIGVVRGETSLGQFLQLRKSRGVLEKAVEELRRENDALGDEI